jgi:hypothetical protein
MNRRTIVPFLVFAVPLLISAAYIFRDSLGLPQTEAGRTAAIAKHIFDNCVTELPKYKKQMLSYEVNEVCSITANDEARKEYAVEKLTGKKGSW